VAPFFRREDGDVGGEFEMGEGIGGDDRVVLREEDFAGDG